MPAPFFDESVPSFLVVADSVSESLVHVTVMTGGGAGRSSDIGFPMSFSIFRLIGLSLWGGGEPGNSMLGELMGVGCWMTSVGMVSCSARFVGDPVGVLSGGDTFTERKEQDKPPIISVQSPRLGESSRRTCCWSSWWLSASFSRPNADLLDIIGVGDGDGTGVGSSCIGDKQSIR